MNFVKKMCILRQVKQGFSEDGRTLSGLIKIEQYGKNVAVEVSVINFAPLSSGEYYCLLADEKERTEILPLRGKSLFNIVSDADFSDGFCGVVCFVKNGITPIAYGVNGNRTYDWRTLVKNTVSPTAASDAAITLSGEKSDVNADMGISDVRKERENREETEDTKEQKEAKEAADTAPKETEKESEPHGEAKENEKDAVKETPKEPPKETTKEEYDDETVAMENYYQREEKGDERLGVPKADGDADDQGGDQKQGEKERKDAAEDDDLEDVRHAFKADDGSVGNGEDGEDGEDGDGYYRAVKREFDELKGKYPTDVSLLGAFPYSEWVRVDEGGRYYLVGVIFEELKAKYICYALPAKDGETPPEEIAKVCAFVPSSPFADGDGFFVIFQSCATGECIRPSMV